MTWLLEFLTGLAVMVCGIIIFLAALGLFAWCAEWLDKRTKICEWRLWTWLAKAFWILAGLGFALFCAAGLADIGREVLS